MISFTPEHLDAMNREQEQKIRRSLEGSGVVKPRRWWFDYVIVGLAAALFGVILALIWWPI